MQVSRVRDFSDHSDQKRLIWKGLRPGKMAGGLLSGIRLLVTENVESGESLVLQHSDKVGNDFSRMLPDGL